MFGFKLRLTVLIDFYSVKLLNLSGLVLVLVQDYTFCVVPVPVFLVLVIIVLVVDGTLQLAQPMFQRLSGIIQKDKPTTFSQLEILSPHWSIKSH